MQTRAAVLEAVGEKFVFRDLQLNGPRADEVVVKVEACGICHTDLSVREGYLPLPCPVVLGHEGAGVVEAVGADVTHVRPGDHVALSFAHCRHCKPCNTGHPAYCTSLLPLNLAACRPDGSSPIEGARGYFFGQSSFASRAVVSGTSAVKVRSDIDFALVAPLGCGIQTGAGAILRQLRPSADASVIVFGVGAVGLSALLAARIVGCSTVVAVDRSNERLALARELGASHCVLAGPDISGELAEISPNGFDYSIDTTANDAVIETAIAALAPMGTCALLGLGGTEQRVSVLSSDMMSKGKVITSISEGDSDPGTFIPELIEHFLAGRFPIDKMVKRYAFDEIDTAFSDLHGAKVLKPVLIMGS